MLKRTVDPTVEPVTLAEVKAHLRIDSDSLADNISALATILAGSHDVAADYGLEGASVEVLGYRVLVFLEAGTCGASGTVDVKLQERDDAGEDWTDVNGGAFTQVTEANDEATYELEYTGTSRYIRAVATIGTAACEFAVTVMRDKASSSEEDLLTSLITVARDIAENFQGRAYNTQTWELWLDRFPSNIYIPRPPLQSVTSIKYYGTDDTEYTWNAAEYFVDSKSEPGRVSRNYGCSYPSTDLRPINGICVTFKAGYGDSGSDVPLRIRQAILLLIGHYYENREAILVAQGVTIAELPLGIAALLGLDRIYL